MEVRLAVINTVVSVAMFTLGAFAISASGASGAFEADISALSFLGNQFDSPIALVINPLSLIEVSIMAIESSAHRSSPKSR